MMCVYLCGVGAKIGYPKSFSDKGWCIDFVCLCMYALSFACIFGENRCIHARMHLQFLFIKLLGIALYILMTSSGFTFIFLLLFTYLFFFWHALFWSSSEGSPEDGKNLDSILVSIRDLEITPEKIREFLPRVNWDQLASSYVAGRSGAECEAR
jgi:hypothetical protein